MLEVGVSRKQKGLWREGDQQEEGERMGQIEQNIATYMSADITLKPITLCIL